MGSLHSNGGMSSGLQDGKIRGGATPQGSDDEYTGEIRAPIHRGHKGRAILHLLAGRGEQNSRIGSSFVGFFVVVHFAKSIHRRVRFLQPRLRLLQQLCCLGRAKGFCPVSRPRRLDARVHLARSPGTAECQHQLRDKASRRPNPFTRLVGITPRAPNSEPDLDDAEARTATVEPFH